MHLPCLPALRAKGRLNIGCRGSIEMNKMAENCKTCYHAITLLIEDAKRAQRTADGLCLSVSRTALEYLHADRSTRSN